MMKTRSVLTKIALVALSLLMLLSLVSCFGPKTETFSAKEVLTDEEMKNADLGKKKTYTTLDITLPTKFKQYDPLSFLGNYCALFDSNKAKILVTNTPVDEEDIGLTSYDYACEISNALGSNAYSPEVIENTPLVYYRYHTKLFGAKLSGACFIIRNGNDVWMVDMVCKADKFEEMFPEFIEWGKTITFTEHPVQEYDID